MWGWTQKVLNRSSYMIEHGVGFVQVWSGDRGGSGNWDNHGDIPKELGPIARSSDPPTAALVTDLAARALFEDTLLIWTTEFGSHAAIFRRRQSVLRPTSLFLSLTQLKQLLGCPILYIERLSKRKRR